MVPRKVIEQLHQRSVLFSCQCGVSVKFYLKVTTKEMTVEKVLLANKLQTGND